MWTGCLTAFLCARIQIFLVIRRNASLSCLPARAAYISGDWLTLFGRFREASSMGDRSHG
jgi:hypothetical protein